MRVRRKPRIHYVNAPSNPVQLMARMLASDWTKRRKLARRLPWSRLNEQQRAVVREVLHREKQPP